MSKMSYYDMNKCLCKELCCEFEKFENMQTQEVLHNIHKLIDSMVGLTELEAAGAMREYLEDEHGYDSKSGEFKGRNWDGYHGIYNDARRYPMMPRNMAYPGYTYTGLPYGKDYDMMDDDDRYMGRMDGEAYDRGRSRDIRGRYNDGRMGIYNMAHMKEHIKEMSDHDYDKWLEGMEGADGSIGPMWTEEETTSVAKRIGIDFNNFTPKEFQVAMDMMYSDMCEVAEEFNVNKPEFYAKLAKAWLLDEDTLKGGEKLSAYHEYVVDN